MSPVNTRRHTYSSTLRTTVLMAALIALLAIAGNAVGGVRGMLWFGGLGLLVNFVTYWFSDKIALMAHRAQPVGPAEAPTLYAIVERLTRRAKIPMPKLYVLPSGAANAFATGRNPSHAAVAVTAGILDILSERELEAVLAHEISHVKNRDVLIGTVAAGIAGLISSVGWALQWGFALGGRSNDDRGGGLSALAWIIVAPIVAALMQMAVSRSREYAADASAAALSGDPEALASALMRLEEASHARPYEHGGPATAHLFIVNPLRGTAAALMNLFSTHPPIEERIRRLQAMSV